VDLDEGSDGEDINDVGTEDDDLLAERKAD
jgi:hypothetical protein